MPQRPCGFRVEIRAETDLAAASRRRAKTHTAESDGRPDTAAPSANTAFAERTDAPIHILSQRDGIETAYSIRVSNGISDKARVRASL